jgi:hypothetical protein
LPEIKGNEKENKAKKPKTTFELFFFLKGYLVLQGYSGETWLRDT